MLTNTVSEIDKALASVELTIRRFGRCSKQYFQAMRELGKLINAIEN